MKKMLIILRHELLTTISRRSFLIFGVLLPIAVMLGLAFFGRMTSAAAEEEGNPPQGESLQTEGFVDHSGLVRSLPGDLPDGVLVRYATEAEAREALESGAISSYYVIPSDILSSGDFTYIRADYSPFASSSQDWTMFWTLMFNLMDGNMEAARRAWNPMNLEVTDLSAEQSLEGACTRPGPYCESNPVLRMLPLFVTVIFFAILMNGAGILMRSVSKEKQNRVMEVLLLSASPHQLLLGKIIGLGLAALLAAASWIISGYLVLGVGGSTLNIPAGFAIPSSVIFWAIAFFVLGYAVYASLMAGAGALVPNLKEISAATWVVASPLFLGYFLAIIAIEAPHGPLATAISLFPLTAPVGMVMRLTIGGVPGWQLALSASLLGLTAVLAVWLSARLFRVQELLSGQPFTPKRYFAALLGRE
ncbi:MAG: ABC transporter permease [Anaerolineales bacterium]|jgi:ABC-2 type transport system permease protein